MREAVQFASRRFHGLCAVLVVCLLIATDAAGAQAPGAISAEEQALRLEESRNQFIRSLDRIPAGGGERSRQRDFRQDLRTFRDQLVGMWALRFAPMQEEWARKDMEDRSDDLGDTLERLRKFVDRGSRPPDFQPEPLDGETLAARLDRMVTVGLRLRDSVIEVTEGDVLDIRVLGQVRSDFATLESWAKEFRQLARSRTFTVDGP